MSRPVASGSEDAHGGIPDKLYFKIGEVSAITGVEPHVLRYWESEIKCIRPQRANSRQRLYRRVDVETILTLKKLLYEEGFTIPGARKFLTSGKELQAKPAGQKSGQREMVEKIKSELQDLKQILEGD
jgi:DNA-binding transcriptional MerR regulator